MFLLVEDILPAVVLACDRSVLQRMSYAGQTDPLLLPDSASVATFLAMTKRRRLNGCCLLCLATALKKGAEQSSSVGFKDKGNRAKIMHQQYRNQTNPCLLS